MTFVSYAQNYEDVMLWRALKHVDKGFYVDVGAYDPLADSVTQAFYERGWHGINIEPVQSYYERICRARPLDINLSIAAADKEGELTFYDIPETGLSTMVETIAQGHHAQGRRVIERRVPVLTLNQILEKHAAGPVHFLKIDVEGAEKTVLQGLDLTRWRPWILVIEATHPLSPAVTLNFADWEPLILTAGYEMGYWDGLNRFYIAHEQSALANSFKTPPNIFDGFLSSRCRDALAERDGIRAELHTVETKLQAALSECDRVRTELKTVLSERDRLRSEFSMVAAERDRLRTELNIIYHSRSWRITAPLRKIVGGGRNMLRFLRRLFPLRTLPKRVALKILRSAFTWVKASPKVYWRADAILQRFPGLKIRLKKFVSGIKPPPPALPTARTPPIPMSPQVKAIYCELVSAIRARRNTRR